MAIAATVVVPAAAEAVVVAVAAVGNCSDAAGYTACSSAGATEASVSAAVDWDSQIPECGTCPVELDVGISLVALQPPADSQNSGW